MIKDKKIILTLSAVFSVFLICSTAIAVPASNKSTFEKITETEKEYDISELDKVIPAGILDTILSFLKKIKNFLLNLSDILDIIDQVIDTLVQIVDLLIELIEGIQSNLKLY